MTDAQKAMAERLTEILHDGRWESTEKNVKAIMAALASDSGEPPCESCGQPMGRHIDTDTGFGPLCPERYKSSDSVGAEARLLEWASATDAALDHDELLTHDHLVGVADDIRAALAVPEREERERCPATGWTVHKLGETDPVTGITFGYPCAGCGGAHAIHTEAMALAVPEREEREPDGWVNGIAWERGQRHGFRDTHIPICQDNRGSDDVAVYIGTPPREDKSDDN